MKPEEIIKGGVYSRAETEVRLVLSVDYKNTQPIVSYRRTALGSRSTIEEAPLDAFAAWADRRRG
jgi:hypothetical protein